MENADYMATHKDYSESVDALERAIAVLKKQAYDRSQAELMQVRFFACCGYVRCARSSPVRCKMLRSLQDERPDFVWVGASVMRTSEWSVLAKFRRGELAEARPGAREEGDQRVPCAG